MAFPFRAWSFGDVGAGHRIAVGAPPAPPPSNGDKVSVDLFVMSKCPDAVYCEGVFANVLARVGEITDLKTHYIAALNETAQYGTQCKHGPDESRWFNFVLCTNRDFRSGDAARDVACARSVHVDYDVDVAPCLASARARELAVTDARVGISRGIQTSCTVQIKQETSVHDGICEAYKGADRSKVAACADVLANSRSTDDITSGLGPKLLTAWPDGLAQCGIWDPSVRDTAFRTRPSEGALNKRRSEVCSLIARAIPA
ncbi:hypothetical protein HKX48_005854 [Thoreauomyces humboldtii]|nr:hypothetical protein HKX48_005854 [Thoreauomyces humboldtii]